MKITFSQTTYNINSNEQIPLIINNINVGTYSFGVYSKWYLKRIEKGARTIPNVGSFVNGLLFYTYGIDFKNEVSTDIVLEKLNTDKDSIGSWFEQYMEMEYSENSSKIRYTKIGGF